MPRTNPAAQPQTPITSVPDATENNAPKDGLAQLSPTPMNDSGSYVRGVKTEASFCVLFYR